jgi:MFS family permease
MSSAIPLGGVIGGFAAQTWLLQVYDWRAVFLFGAVVTALMIPLVMLFVSRRRRPS